MQNERAALTAASTPVVLSGRTLQFSPLSDKDIAELDRYIQARYIQLARESLPASATEQERKETLSLAMTAAAGLTWMSGVGQRMMATVEGMARLCWQSVKKNHDDVSLEWLTHELFDPSNLDAVKDAFKVANHVDESERVQSAAGSKKKRRLKPRSTGGSRKRTGGRRRK